MSGSAGISKKSLFLNRPDVGRANNLASEAFQYATYATCGFSDPNAYNFGLYGRSAHIDSLPMGGNGAYASPCSNLGQQNLQRRIQIENNVERQFIDFSMTPGLQYPYDTMGKGRTMIEQRGGGSPGCMYNSPGGWGQQYNMPADSMPGSESYGAPSPPPLQFMESLNKPPKDRLQLHYAFANRYSG